MGQANDRGPPTNIPTTNHVFPADLIDTGIGRRNGIGDGITERADAEHATALRHHIVTGLLVPAWKTFVVAGHSVFRP